MASSAIYTGTPQSGNAVVTTGDTSRTAPTNFAYVYTAGVSGGRIDSIDVAAIGATVLSTYRLFLVPGTPGVAIASITFSTTTATVTTSSNHGMSTGMKVTVKGALPMDYNVSHAAITVSSTTVFTYTMATTPTTNATGVGAYTYTVASPTFALWLERPVTAVTPSGTVQVYSDSLSTQTNPNLFPLILQAGWALAASVNDTQTSSGLNILPINAGDF
jgi:hypothetical protein